MAGGRNPLRLPHQTRYRNTLNSGKGYAPYANVSNMTGMILARNLATLRELQTFYSLEDALNLLEVINVHNYNDWMTMENAKRR